MRPQSYSTFQYPCLNSWFQPSYESLIQIANRKSGWGALDEDPTPDEPKIKEYAQDYFAVAGLIRVCATWKSTRDQIVDQLLRPFSLTVIETGDSFWVEAVENALADGLIPAMCQNNQNVQRPNIVSYKALWRKTTPTKTASDFGKALARAAKEAAPMVVVVPSVDVLPEAICRESTQIHVLAPLSRSMMLMLYTMMHGRQAQGMMTKALRKMPSDDALGRTAPTEFMLALRAPKLMRFVSRLNALTARTTANPQALDDVKGLGSAREQLQRLIDDIRAYATGTLSWADIPNNVLFDGPPGVGKTFAAQKLAEATGAYFVGASYSRWQADGHLGDFLAAMRDDFEEAKRNAPAVLLIDEIDSFSDRASNTSSNQDYTRAAMNGLLEQLAGAEKTDGVLVVGTTNYPDKLDAALLRSGRFDQKIHLPLPDKEGLTDILLLHCGPQMSRADLHKIAIEMLGQSGADAAALVRQARSFARQEGRALAFRHLKSALKLFAKPLPTATLHRVALHEAGHIVVAQSLNAGLPQNAYVSSKGGRVDMDVEQYELEAETLEHRLAILFAGRAAEISFLGSVSSGAGISEQSDLAQATHLAVQAESQFGLSNEHLIWRPVSVETLPELLKDGDLANRVQLRLRSADRLAEKIVSENANMVEGVAKALVEKRHLNRLELEQLLHRLSSARKKVDATEQNELARPQGWLH